jgi:tryptophan-rich sensory protein
MKTWWAALAFVLVCQMAGVVGAVTTETGSSGWYQALEKPGFQPPGWVFGPVWTLLYAMMGLAAWRIACLGTARADVRRALLLFGIQLAINAIWSPVFFAWHQVGLALGVLVALWVAIVVTTWAFSRLDRLATALMAPYIAWVSFAVVLNAAILHLN